MTKTLLETWAQLRTKYLVPSIWYQVSGTKYLVPTCGIEAGRVAHRPKILVYIYIYVSYMDTYTYTFTYIDAYLCKTDLARDRKVNALFFFIHSADLAGGGGGKGEHPFAL